MKIKLLIIVVLFCTCIFVFAQETVTPVTGAEESTVPKPPEPTKKVNPVFPDYNTNIIFIEGEDAAATNFSKEPIVNFGCSGKKTLQLSRTTGLQDGAPFYADFLFYVDQAGTYEFWYGGTPSGPKDQLAESYSSPFSYIIDDTGSKTAYREEMAVVENYAPAYYWNRVHTVTLSEGQHRIRFEVSERRRYDSRFYFYLDAFFFIRKDGTKRIAGTILPDTFPKNMDNTKINYFFKPIDDYLILIRDNPQDVAPLLEISMIYSLASDYLNAIKYLKRAAILEPENQSINLLIAKNNIWKGQIDDGLEKYQELLKVDPTLLEIWLEAGKVAAWTGRYTESVRFYDQALENFPDNLDLEINKGVTLLWANKVLDAEALFNKLRTKYKDDREMLIRMAKIFDIAGYPKKAIEIYVAVQTAFPEYIESYILETELLRNTGDNNEADRVDERIRKQFNESARLSSFMEIQKKKQTLKDWLINDYREKLAEEPDNLELRELLAQTLFWNNKQKEATGEYLNIFTNHAYNHIKTMDENGLYLYETIDKAVVLSDVFNGASQRIAAIKTRLEEQRRIYTGQAAELDAVKKKIETAKGESLTGLKVKETELAAKVSESDKKLREIIGEGYILIEQFRTAQILLSNIKESVDEITADEYEEAENFKKIISVTNWEWDKKEFIAELRYIESTGLFLAEHILAKIAHVNADYLGAEQQIRAEVKEGNVKPETKYLYFEALLWDKKAEEAIGYYLKNSAEIDGFADYTTNIITILQNLRGKRDYNVGISNDFTVEIQKVSSKLDEEVKSLTQEGTVADEYLSALTKIYQARLVRTIYAYEENTYLVRNELGQFYLQLNDLKSAIRQFKLVLAMDPWDLQAVYQLGIAYKLNNNWSMAQELFRKVYDLDPKYELAATYYNEIARAHSSLFDVIVETTAEPKGVDIKTELSYTQVFNDFAALEVWYNLDYFRYSKLYGTPINPYAYDVHGIGAGIELNFDIFKIKPIIGVSFYLADSYYSEIATNSLVSPMFFDKFYNYSGVPEPFGGIVINADFENIVFLLLQGGYERITETFGYHIARETTIWAKGDFTIDLNQTKIPILKGLRNRIHGKYEYLSDGNMMYAVGDYLDFKLLEMVDPIGFDLTLHIHGLYEDSVNEQPTTTEYYKPKEKLEAIGGLTGALYFSLGDSKTIGISLDVAAGPVFEFMFQDTNRGTGIKYSGVLSIDYIFGESRIYLQANGSITNYSEHLKWPTSVGWTYFQTTIRLGYSASLPSLIVP